jgi:regulatory protein
MSAQEMERRLLSKGESQETAQETVKWLEDIGAIDDVEYSKNIVRHYSSKGYGPARIRDELFKRGIPRDMWEDALSEIDDISDAAHEFLEKKLQGSRDKADLRRATDALCRRGFSYEDARVALGRYIEEKDAES